MNEEKEQYQRSSKVSNEYARAHDRYDLQTSESDCWTYLWQRIRSKAGRFLKSKE